MSKIYPEIEEIEKIFDGKVLKVIIGRDGKTKGYTIRTADGTVQTFPITAINRILVDKSLKSLGGIAKQFGRELETVVDKKDVEKGWKRFRKVLMRKGMIKVRKPQKRKTTRGKPIKPKPRRR